MKINNKIMNKIIAKYIVKSIDKYSVEWIEKYGITLKELKEYLHIHFNNWFYYVCKKFLLLKWFLCLLCDIEMQLKVFCNKEFLNYINNSDIGDCGENHDESQAMIDIPKNSFYCSGCPFYDRSNIARTFFGTQSDGYCYYLNRGDFSYIRPTMLLWDGCKECGINEDIETESEEIENGK